jgi:hypothetical protein
MSNQDLFTIVNIVLPIIIITLVMLCKPNIILNISAVLASIGFMAMIFATKYCAMTSMYHINISDLKMKGESVESLEKLCVKLDKLIDIYDMISFIINCMSIISLITFILARQY